MHLSMIYFRSFRQVLIPGFRFRLGQLDTARASLIKAETIEQTQLPKMESGDLGTSWIDWVVAHALLKEARELIKKQ